MGVFTVTVQELIADGFDFGLTKHDYPIWDERYRGIQKPDGSWDYLRSPDGGEWFGLNRKILDHFLYYEIGQETPDMFRHVLNRTMREVMPYYNRLYATEASIDDPFRTMDMTHTSLSEAETDSKTVESTESKAGSKNDAKSRVVNSSFPQTMLNESGDYASSATDSLSEGSTSQDGTSKNDVVSKGTNLAATQLHITGSQGSRAALIQGYRESLINVDLMVLNELRPLFMLVADTTDNHTERYNHGLFAPSYFGHWPYF